MSPFTVTVGSVHGPLEVVLEMVEKRKLFVNDVSLAQITDDYVRFVQEGSVVDAQGVTSAIALEERAAFVAVASALLLLKARSLLPSFTLTRDEELQVSGLRRDLERYAYFRKIARALEKVWGAQYVPEQKKEGRKAVQKARGHDVHIFAPGGDVTREHLLFAIQSLLTGLPQFTKPLHTTVVRSIKSIEQVVVEIVERLARTPRASFSSHTKGAPKEEVVVYFLAMLELVKRGVIDAEQDTSGNRHDILLKKVTGGVMHVSG